MCLKNNRFRFTRRILKSETVIAIVFASHASINIIVNIQVQKSINYNEMTLIINTILSKQLAKYTAGIILM